MCQPRFFNNVSLSKQPKLCGRGTLTLVLLCLTEEYLSGGCRSFEEGAYLAGLRIRIAFIYSIACQVASNAHRALRNNKSTTMGLRENLQQTSAKNFLICFLIAMGQLAFGYVD